MKKEIDERLQNLAKRIMKAGEQMADKDKVIAELWHKYDHTGEEYRLPQLLSDLYDAGRREGLEEAAKIALLEKVDADDTQAYDDFVYNRACEDCAAEIRRSLSREKDAKA